MAKLKFDFVPIPHSLLDDDLQNGKITPSEYVVLTVIFRKSFGWSRIREWIKTKELAKRSNMSYRSIGTITSKLKEKGYIEIIFVCPDCKEVTTYEMKNHSCQHCQSKNTPHKCYEQNIIENSDEETQSERRAIASTSSNICKTPLQNLLEPLANNARQTTSKPLHSNELYDPKETSLKETLLKSSLIYDCTRSNNSTAFEISEKNQETTKVEELGKESNPIFSIPVEKGTTTNVLTKSNQEIQSKEKENSAKEKEKIVNTKQTIDDRFLEIMKSGDKKMIAYGLKNLKRHKFTDIDIAYCFSRHPEFDISEYQIAT